MFDFCHPNLINKSNYKGIIFRRTFPRLREIVDRSQLWFRDTANYSQNERCWTFQSGAKLYFAHCQYEESKYDYQGQEYHYMGFDQLEEFTSSQYDFLKVQARTTDPEIHVRIRATANPGNVGHVWVKKRFIDKKIPFQVYHELIEVRGKTLKLNRMFIPAKVWDNPSLMENDPLYIARLKALPEQERKALLEGDWNIFAGQFFKEWTPGIHVVKPYHIPVVWERFIGGDYGFKKPCSIGWYAVSPEGMLVRYKEIYKEGLYYADVAKQMLELSEGEDIGYAVFDPSVFGDKQHHSKKLDAREAESGAEIMQGIIGSKFLITRGDNRRSTGWSNLRNYLKIEDGKANFEVFETCIGFTETFPANIHDDKKPEDLDTNGEDHTADEARYAAASKPRRTKITVEKLAHPNSPRAKIDGMKRRRRK